MQIEDVLGAIATTDGQVLVSWVIAYTEAIIRDSVPVLHVHGVVVQLFGDVEGVEF